MKWLKISYFLKKKIQLKKKNSLMQIEELRRFMQIRSGGLSLKDCIEICFENSQEILQQLENGFSFREVVSHSQGRAFRQLNTLLQNLSLETSLSVFQQITESQAKMEKMLIRQTAYPLFLMAFSYGMICFFSASIFPAMQMYDTGNSGFILNLLKMILTWIWTGLFLLGTGYCLHFYGPVRIQILETIMDSIPAVQKMQTCQLAAVMKALVHAGMSTAKTLEVMGNFSSLKFISHTAVTWSSKIQKGKNLLQCIEEHQGIDPDFIPFFRTGIQSSSLELLLSSYQNLTLDILQKQVKKAALWVQISSYGCVGFLVIAVYQIMFMPLSMLETF